MFMCEHIIIDHIAWYWVVIHDLLDGTWMSAWSMVQPYGFNPIWGSLINLITWMWLNIDTWADWILEYIVGLVLHYMFMCVKI